MNKSELFYQENSVEYPQMETWYCECPVDIIWAGARYHKSDWDFYACLFVVKSPKA